jgi:hypothetical protein
MTEESYQQCRKIMQKINYRRGLITKAKGDVAKWTKIEMSHRSNLQHGKADGAQKMLEKAMKKLEEQRKIFAEMEFPDSNIQASSEKKSFPCKGCSTDCYNFQIGDCR